MLPRRKWEENTELSLEETSFSVIYLGRLSSGVFPVSLTLREECRLRVFENMILRRIFGPKGDENGEWRRLHNEELHSLYRSPIISRIIKSRRLKWTRNVARMEEGRSAFKILTGKPTGKRPLGRPMRKWEDNIRMDLKEIGINTRNWIDSAQDYCRVLTNAALNASISQDVS